MGFHFVWYVRGGPVIPRSVGLSSCPQGLTPQHRGYSQNYQANHTPGAPLSLQLGREMPRLACKLKVAVPDRYRRLITFSHRGGMGLDYGSSDLMHVTVITVNRFSRDFPSERMWWS